VETALVVPFLVFILVGSAELGRIAYASIEVANAARAGAAFGEQSGTAAAPIGLTDQAIKQAAENDAADFVSGFNATPNVYCVCLTTNAGTGTASSTPQVLCGSSTANSSTYCPTSTVTNVRNTIIRYVEVSTTGTVNTMFRYPGLPSSYTVKGYAELRENE
jgi:Flp pilus assembly protein TadG